jgi:chromosomal replication initiation ATPase DnaA
MRQEVFDFHKTERLDWSDFIESDENRDAIFRLAKWPDWDSFGTIVCGESGTGKTHLAALWAQTANAVYVLKGSLNRSPRDLFDAECNFVIDNFDDFISPQNYDWMFHFLNVAKEKNRYFLILSRSRSSILNAGLDDLRSRLLALPFVRIAPPADGLLLKISQKIARDLEITVPCDVMTRILNHVERKVGSGAEVLKTLDKLSLRQKKTLSLAFVKKYFACDLSQ